MKLLIIRPEPGASKTANRARMLGFDPVTMPMFEIVPQAWVVPNADAYDALLISSANTIRHGGAGLKSLLSLPVFAVGKASADASAEAGFEVAATGQEGAQSALNLARDNGHQRILWLAGMDHVSTEPETDIRVVYQACELDAPDQMIELLRSGGHVVLHSPRAAQHFAAFVEKNKLDHGQISIVAISENVAVAAASGWAKMAVASAPDDASLLAAALTCFTNAGDVS